jgi:hypothetical protein
MRFEERRLLKFGLVGGGVVALIPVLFLTFLLFLGLSVAPTPPAIENSSPPPLLEQALWARAGGGRATELRSINPISVVGHIACRELADVPDNPRPEHDAQADECAEWLPAMAGLGYLSDSHVTDLKVERNSFRGGAGAFATMLRISASWTREDLLNTLAARADYGYGWRGMDAAALGYFNKTPDQLGLHEAAMIAAMAGERYFQPWCHPAGTTEHRNRLLARMRHNGAISEDDYRAAATMPLGLASPPEGRPACRE